MATAIFAGQKTTCERAPDRDAEPLVNQDWHKFVFGLGRLQRIVDLLANRPVELHELRHADRLHQVPTGEVGHADVAHLAGTDETVERLKSFFERRLFSFSAALSDGVLDELKQRSPIAWLG
jgi:hypothetical protein